MKNIIKRVWLNPKAKDLTAHIVWGIRLRKKDLSSSDVTFTLADCYRRVELDFSVHSKERREEALIKARTLLKEITDFTNALENLCQNIDK